MNRATRRAVAAVAKRPPARTIDVTLPDDHEFAGWHATARADFPGRLLEQLQSSNVAEIMAVLDAIVIEHNMPNSRDELAGHMNEVDPYRGMLAIAGALFDELGKLPPR